MIYSSRVLQSSTNVTNCENLEIDFVTYIKLISNVIEVLGHRAHGLLLDFMFINDIKPS